MSIIKLMDSSLPQNWSEVSKDQDAYMMAPVHCEKIAYTLFNGVVDCLAAMKSKEHPVTYTFTKPNGEFVAACTVFYNPTDDKENADFWNVSWTFYKEDIPEDSFIIDIADTRTWQYFRGVAGSKYSMSFEINSEGIIMTRFLTCLISWLNENYTDDEIVGIELDGVFEAKVGTEDGEKIMTLECKGETKANIKKYGDEEAKN